MSFVFASGEMVSPWDRRAFVRAPWRFYRGDPYWAPPLLSERLALLDPYRNPFLRSVKLALFCAEASSGITLEEVVGTIAVWIDVRKNDVSDEAVGCFGLFESINNEEVVSALLAHAEEWLREHLPGVEVMRGPASLNPAHASGEILVDGFNSLPGVMMPYSAPCYSEMIEATGFEAGAETLALRLDLSESAAECASVGSNCARQAEALAARLEVIVQSFDPQDIRDEGRRVKRLCDLTWAAAVDIAPLTDEEFAWLAHGFARYLDREVLRWDRDSRRAGRLGRRVARRECGDALGKRQAVSRRLAGPSGAPAANESPTSFSAPCPARREPGDQPTVVSRSYRPGDCKWLPEHRVRADRCRRSAADIGAVVARCTGRQAISVV